MEKKKISEKQKVCHLTSVHSNKDIRIFIKECSSLTKAGYETHLVYLGEQEENTNTVFFHAASSKPRNRFLRIIKGVWKIYKTAFSIKAELYHFHDPELLLVGLMLKIQGYKVIYDVHEDLPRQILSKYWIKPYFRRIISSIAEFIENLVSARMDAIITATPHIAQRFKWINDTSIVIGNFPILSELFTDDSFGEKNSNAVCYVGSISEIRGIFEMVEAISLTNGILLLAGRFSNSKSRNLLTSKTGWQQVKELGILKRDEVKEILNGSQAGLVLFHPEPNHINAQPNKLFEYMSAGIPVICSDFKIWRELIEKYKCGLCVNPLIPQEIANAIQYILDNLADAHKMGINGRKAIEVEYNWEHESEKLIDLYKQILS